MMYSAYKLNKQGDNIQPWHTPFLIWNQPVVPSWPAYRFLKRQVRWLSLSDFPQFVVIHTVEGFGIVNKAEIDDFLELSCFFDEQRMLAIWSLVPLLFLNAAWSSGSSRFMYRWSLAWRILSIILLACEMSAMCGGLSIVWHCLSLGLGRKLTFSSPVATAEFSKCAGTLSAALSQHYLVRI